MKRVLFNITSALSLLAALGTAAAWFRNLYLIESASWTSWYDSNAESASLRRLEVGWGKGRIWIEYERSTFHSQKLLQAISKYNKGGLRVDSYDVDSGLRIQMVDNGWWRFDSTSKSTPAIQQNTRRIQLPAPVLLAILLLLPGAWYFRRSKTRKRLRTGLCPNCGYDLRESPDRCPECGASVSKQEAR